MLALPFFIFSQTRITILDMRKITVFEYIAINKPTESVALLRKYGCTIKMDVQWIASALKACVDKYGEGFAYDLAQLHPDRTLLLETLTKDDVKEMANACGCMAAEGIVKPEGFALEKPVATEPKEDAAAKSMSFSKETVTLVIFSSLALLTLVTITALGSRKG